MEQLWAPWRMTYIRGELEGAEKGCVFCLPEDRGDDGRRLVLCRGETAFVILNKYPYTNGHLMVAPYRHVSDTGRLAEGEVLEMHRLLVLAQEVLREISAPQGFNVGMNLGRIAGAGIEDHLHLHLVPRWSGDTNFMPVFADVRVIPQHLEETYQILRQGFARRGR
jgi:ATP adenylyltransferase